MRIAQVSTVAAPVRRHPGAGGSVESQVWLLTRELRRLGHDVTVFACAGSEMDGDLVATLPGPYASGGSPGDWQLCEWVNLTAAIGRSADFDLLHSHAYLWGLPLEPLSAAPMVHTLHVWPYDDAAFLWRSHPRAVVTAPSRAQWRRYPDLRPRVVANAVDTEDFTFNPTPDGYLCWLGRFIPGKGPLAAIDTARRSGRELVLAGPANDYFDQVVRPLVDGTQVSYVGELSPPERDKMLGGAATLLYPVEAAEPFGLVLAEAMLCGTPVAAVRRGAVGEIVDEDVTGVTVAAASADRLADAVERTVLLDRAAVRAAAECRFSPRRMVQGYEQVYREAAGRRP